MFSRGCEHCWDYPCTCGLAYEKWSKKEIGDLIQVLYKIMNKKGLPKGEECSY